MPADDHPLVSRPDGAAPVFAHPTASATARSTSRTTPAGAARVILVGGPVFRDVRARAKRQRVSERPLGARG
jgi:hypothetical protein